MSARGNGSAARSSYDFYRGERIGKYQVLTQLSMGGMAELFLGFTSGPGGFRKYVALKRILPDARSNEQFERMFLDEARITAAFNHPNIAQVYELGQQDDGLFLAMEFIAGQNLNQITNACARRQERVPLGMSLAVVRDVCLALHYAHTFKNAAGRSSPVIHRDVAQKNVMLTYEGVVKLLDFGVAKARGSLERTRAGTVKGTAGYMSPEQVRGEPLDGRSDLFSVGVVLYELVTGERLFAGKTEREEMIKILEAPIPRPRHRIPHVPEEISALVLKALERNPGNRFQSGKDMARALEVAAGRLLFDMERRAAFMHELFEKKMAATRALLESADAVEGISISAGPAVEVLKEDDGGVFLESRQARWTGSEGDTPRPSSMEADEDLDSRAAVLRAQAASTIESALQEGGRLSGTLWAVLLLAMVVVGCFGVLHLVQKLDADVEPEPSLKSSAEGSQLRAFQEPIQARPPGVVGAANPLGGAAAASAKGPASDEVPGALGEEEGSGQPQSAARVQQGRLTLVTQPDAEVFRNQRSLGRTPLFNVPLPVGTHLLRIVGFDGKRRVLSVPIQAGKTAAFRLQLSEIPEG